MARALTGIAGVAGTLVAAAFYCGWELWDRMNPRRKRVIYVPVRRCKTCKDDDGVSVLWLPSFCPDDKCPVCGEQVVTLTHAHPPSDAECREYLRRNQPPRIATDAELADVLSPEELAELAADKAWIEERFAAWPLGEEAEVFLALCVRGRRDRHDQPM